jgi:hypothetical protein
MNRRFLWKVSSYSPTILAISAYVFKVIWSDIDLYHAYRDFTTDPVRYPASVMRDFISELASVPAPSVWVLIDVRTAAGCERATLRTDRGRGDPRVDQQD